MTQQKQDQNIPITPSQSAPTAGGLKFDSRIVCSECHCQLSSAAQLFLHEHIHKATFGDLMGLNKLPFALVPALAEVLDAWLARNSECGPFVDHPPRDCEVRLDDAWLARNSECGPFVDHPPRDCEVRLDHPSKAINRDTGQLQDGVADTTGSKPRNPAEILDGHDIKQDLYQLVGYVWAFTADNPRGDFDSQHMIEVVEFFLKKHWSESLQDTSEPIPADEDQ